MAHGKKTGGRQKGAKNKTTILHEKMVVERLGNVVEEGILPLEVMMQAMRKAWIAGDYKEAVMHAERAAPYVHHKLAAVTHSGDSENPVAFNITSGVTREHDTTDDDDRPHTSH